MTKDQLIDHIAQTAKSAECNMKQALRDCKYMTKTDDAVLVEAILSVGAGICDGLNSIALALSETLPKEE